MNEPQDLLTLLQQHIPWQSKEAIQPAAARFGDTGNGDDGALLPNPNGSGWIIIAAEGITEDFLQQDPWFAGWSAIMANVADITAMGGQAIAAVDVQWSCNEQAMDGLAAAAAAFQVPIVGGHSGRTNSAAQLAVAIVGHTEAPLFGHGAQVGDDLIAVIDQRGQWCGNFPFWNAATTAPPQRLRADLQIIPKLSAAGLLRCGRDISMGGIYQTAALIAERSAVTFTIDPLRVPGVIQERTDQARVRRLVSFPSYGYLFSVDPQKSSQVLRRFAERDLDAHIVGHVTAGPAQVQALIDDKPMLLRDLSRQPLTGFTTLLS